MKVKGIVLILAVVFTTFGYAKAEEPTMVNPQPVQVKPQVEADEPLSILTAINENTESKEQEFFYPDSSLNEAGYINFTFQPKHPLDSVNTKGVLNYLRHVMPVIRKMDEPDIEMIEIL